MGHGYIINNEYQVHAEIASGSYGKVYTGKCLHSNEPIIIKVERKEVTSHHVEGEVAVYKDLGPSCKLLVC